MANNNKKEFPVNGLEIDCLSDWGRRYLCYVRNCNGIKKYVKRLLNKRFRKYNKLECRNYGNME